MTGRALVLKVDTERHADITNRFAIRSIPNSIVLKNGTPVVQHAGAVDHRHMQSWLEQASATK